MLYSRQLYVNAEKRPAPVLRAGNFNLRRKFFLQYIVQSIFVGQAGGLPAESEFGDEYW